MTFNLALARVPGTNVVSAVYPRIEIFGLWAMAEIRPLANA
jgi:hypothetical protein